METIMSNTSSGSITTEDKFTALKSLFGSVKEKEAQKQIQELEDLANTSEMKDFILEDQTLASDYTYSDFLDEIFRCLKKITSLQEKFICKKKDAYSKKGMIYNKSENTF